MLGKTDGPGTLREPGFDIGDLIPAFDPPTDDLPLPKRASAAGAEFPCDWPVWDQGKSQSCTANAVAAALMHLLLREATDGFNAPVPDDPEVSPSREFLYYEEQRVMRELGQDQGVWVRVAVSNLQRFGACSDATWNALPDEFQDQQQWKRDMQAELLKRGVLDEARSALPLQARHLGRDVRDAKLPEDHRSARLRDITPMKRCIQEGYPFVMAIDWYSAWDPPAEERPAGDFPLPAVDSTELGSGHSMLVVGYDDEFTSPLGDYRGPRWLARDSRGAGGGHDGYYSLPYEWATNPCYSHGLWTLRRR